MERLRDKSDNGILCNHFEIKSSIKNDHIIEKNMNKSILIFIILINSFMCSVKGAGISLETEMTISQNILNFRFSASG